MPASVDRIREAISPVLVPVGVDLESVQVQSAGRRELIRVVVDRDGGVDLDLIAALSRDIAEVLDSPELGEALPGTYVLEVTSPGVDRPLTEARHWRRAVGRLVEATMTDGTVVTGRVEAADESSVRIDGRAIAMADLVRGMVQVEFSRSDADDTPTADPDVADADQEG